MEGQWHGEAREIQQATEQQTTTGEGRKEAATCPKRARKQGGQYDETNGVELKGAGNEAGTVCKRQEACCTLSCSSGPGEGDGWVDSVSLQVPYMDSHNLTTF